MMAAFAAAVPSASIAQEGEWLTTGALTTARSVHTATLLANGKVLVAGGRTGLIGASLASSELYDPKTETWSSTAGSLAESRFGHSATLLDGPECQIAAPPVHCGKVLVAGGFTGETTTNAQPVLTSAELFDPTTGTWAAAGALSTRRSLHAASLLADGRVLVAGGRTCNAPPPTQCNSTFVTNTAEIYNPATNSWSPTGPLLIARHTNAAVLLPNGKVLVPGGFGGDVPAPAESSAELFTPASDPAAGSWATCPTAGSSAECPGPLPQQHARAGATLLPNGKVIVAAGFPQNDDAELYDIATGTWSPAANLLASGRFNHYYTLLPNGKYLLAGGANTSATTAEVYDPALNVWT